jgi:hypothetical protein
MGPRGLSATTGRNKKAQAMPDFGPSAAFLIAFIGVIGSILSVYAGTGLAGREGRMAKAN